MTGDSTLLLSMSNSRLLVQTQYGQCGNMHTQNIPITLNLCLN